ncbi:hypothetical protein AOLI_G00134790 [Acnodon oligacanthus]
MQHNERELDSDRWLDSPVLIVSSTDPSECCCGSEPPSLPPGHSLTLSSAEMLQSAHSTSPGQMILTGSLQLFAVVRERVSAGCVGARLTAQLTTPLLCLSTIEPGRENSSPSNLDCAQGRMGL